MPIFETWDIVKVPFPYTNRPVRQRRPALVIADGTQTVGGRLLWILMITSAENRGWTGDVEISDIRSAGLPAASIVRTAKVATIESDDAVRLGNLADKDRPKVSQNLRLQLSHALA